MASKVARLSTNPNGVDRISNLPDAVLCHILSYLSTKYSVRTRILSTRWKYLFTLVPVLDFFSPLNCYTPETIQPFLEFVNFVFSSYNVDRMDRFCYSSSSSLLENEGPRLASWIQDSVNRGVSELRVVKILSKPQTLPQNLFTSKTITFLYIHGNFILDVPDNVWLPCVRNVDFLGVTFLNNGSVRRLFQSFPVLENLFLNNCCTENIQVLHICIPTLVTLKIHGFKDEYELVLDVPNVKYFEYHGYESLGFSMRNELKLLVNASISFPTWSFSGYEALPRLFSIISHVQEINICAYTLEAFRRFGLTLPTFHNLTHLELRVISSLDFELGLLVDLLDRTPHLGVLLFDNGCSSEFEPSDLVPQHVPMCVSTHLKVIEIKGFSLLVYECTLVEYFLKNAKVLHTLYIQTMESLEKQFDMSKKLLTFSRCSRDCQVILDSIDGGLQ